MTTAIQRRVRMMATNLSSQIDGVASGTIVDVASQDLYKHQLYITIAAVGPTSARPVQGDYDITCAGNFVNQGTKYIDTTLSSALIVADGQGNWRSIADGSVV